MGIKFREDLFSRVFIFATFANEHEIKDPRNSLSSNKVLCFLVYFRTLTFFWPFVSLLFLKWNKEINDFLIVYFSRFELFLVLGFFSLPL